MSSFSFGCTSDSSTAFHAAFGFIIVVLLALLQVKYQSTSVSPFQTHAAYMSVFIAAVFVYTATLLVVITQPNHGTNDHTILKHICLISGALASDQLLLILVPPFGYFFFALCGFLIVRVLYLYRQQIYEKLCHAAIQVCNILYEWLRCIFQSMCKAVSQAFRGLQDVFQWLCGTVLKFWLCGTVLNKTSASSMEQQQESGGYGCNIQIVVTG